MNIKLIDFAARAYERDGDTEACARIALLRPVWGIQARVAEQASAALETAGWCTPAADDLTSWYRAGMPFLRKAPAPVDGALLAATAREVAEALAGSDSFDEATVRALRSCDWETLVECTATGLAGSDPAAYLDAVAASTTEGNGNLDDAVQTKLLVLALALRPQLDPVAEATMAALKPRLHKDRAKPSKPRRCPVCDSVPGLAYVGPTEDNKANGRTLYCAQCGATWEFERVRCVRCGTTDQEKLHYKSIEGDDMHRLHICDACNGYLRSFFSLDDNLRAFVPEVEDAVMANLDAVAAELGLGLGE